MVATAFPRADEVAGTKVLSSKVVVTKLPVLAELFLPDPDKFKYHNWEHHVSPMVTVAKEICLRCQKKGLKPDVDVVVASVLLHDIFYDRNPSEVNALNPEHLSAIESYRLLKKMGASEDFARRVESAIQDTHVNVTPTTLEGKILRASDLYRVGLSYETYNEDSRLLYLESKLALGRTHEFPEFFEKAIGFLSMYVSYDIRLTGETHDPAGRSNWHRNAITYMHRTLSEARGQNVNVFVDLSSNSSRSFDHVNTLAGSSEFIIFVADSDSRKVLDTAKNSLNINNRQIISLPGTSSSAPINDGMASCVYLDTPRSLEDIAEARRLIKPEGKIIINGELEALRLLLKSAKRELNLQPNRTNKLGENMIELTL